MDRPPSRSVRRGPPAARTARDSQRSAPGRRSLAQVGGAARRSGDPALSARLAEAARIPRDANPRALTHGFHPWPARMHPHTARLLLDLVRDREATAGVAPSLDVVDPFMGGGTVIVEALVAGRGVRGGDVNPVGVEVAWARTRRWGAQERQRLVDRARVAVRGARKRREQRPRVPRAFFEAEGAWFDPPALVDVWTLREALGVEPHPPTRRILRACLSSILVKASRQATDSVTTVDREHRWVPRDRVLRWFEARAEELAQSLEALHAAAPPGAPEPLLKRRDARRPFDGPVAAVVTSPPYPGTYDYAAHHARRYAALGLDAQAVARDEIGARSQQRAVGWRAAADAFAEDLGVAMSAWRQALAPWGLALLVIGDGQRPGGVLHVQPLVERAAGIAGFEVVAAVSQRRRLRGHLAPERGGDKKEYVVALAPR